MSLTTALLQWAEQTGFNVIVPICNAAEESARPIRGVDPLDALEQLIFGTDLTYSLINSHTVAIQCLNE